MQSASATFATTVAGVAMSVDATVTIVLPVSLSITDVSYGVESIKIDEALTTDAPAGTRAATGRAAASADIVLASPDLCALLNPYNTSSAIYRSSMVGYGVVVRYGIEGETLVKFTGVIQSYDVDMEGGTVALQCIDNRGTAQGRVQLPAFQAKRDVPALVVGSPGLAATYVIEHLARNAGYHTCPPPRTGALLFASMHGSLYPEIIAGNGNRAASRYGAAWSARETVDMVTGRYGSQVAPDSNLVIGLQGGGGYAYPFGSVNRALYIEGWIKPLATAPADTQIAQLAAYGGVSTTDGPVMRVLQSGTQIKIRTEHRRNGAAGAADADRSTYATPTLTNGYVHVAARWQYTTAAPTSVQHDVWINGFLQYTAPLALGTPALLADTATGYAYITASVPLDSVQVCTDYTATPASSVAYVPTAYVESTPETLDYMPAFGPDADPWSALQVCADALQGVVRFDELGALRFVARKTLRGGAVARAISSGTSLKRLATTADRASASNRVRLPLSQWASDRTGYVWSADYPITLDPRETKELRITSDGPPLIPYPVNLMDVNTTGIPSQSAGDFRMSTTADGVGSTIMPDYTSLTVTVQVVSPSELIVRITSNVGVKVWLIAPAGDLVYTTPGTPVLRLPGIRLAAVQAPVVLEAVKGAGDRLLALAQTPMCQNATAMYRVEDVLGDLYRARPVWAGTSIVPDARLQLGDRVSVSDPYVNGLSGEEGAVVGMTHDLSEGSWSQELDIRTASSPGGWILSRTGRGEIASTDYI